MINLVHNKRGDRRGVLASMAALLVGACLLAMASPSAHAQIALEPNAFTMNLTGAGGTPLLQAGAHPDITTTFKVGFLPGGEPTGRLRNVEVKLPPGVVGNANATPKCTVSQAAYKFVPGTAPCPLDTAVGVATVSVYYAGSGAFDFTNVLIYNIEPYKDEPAAFAFYSVAMVRLDASVRSDSDYGVTLRASNLTEAAPIVGGTITFWGVPADHNGVNPPYANGSGTEYDPFTDQTYGGRGVGMRRPLLSNASSCGAAPLPVSLGINQWDPPFGTASDQVQIGPFTGCDKLNFDPKITVKPSTRAAGAPAGYAVDIDVPQNADPDGLDTPSLKDATVTLPEGVALSPSVAHGLGACSDGQIGLHSLAASTCPNASKVGTVTITTPLLPGPIDGSVYIGEPLPGNRYRIFFSLEGYGVRVKLEGRVTPDPVTGQLTTTFLNNPQVPFSNLHVQFKGGPNAPLANPTTCGTKTAKSQLVSFAGQTASPSDDFKIDSNCGGAAFAPTMTAGSANSAAGASSPFELRVSRGDGQPVLDRISTGMPPGLLGMVSQVPQCPAAKAAAGTCGPESQIGTTTVSAGPGTDPFPVDGKVFLTEGYKGAPYGLAFLTHVVAGPYDLGFVNVRAAITVDRRTAALRVESDPLPTILEGIPLQIRDVRIKLNRDGFMRNPTSCAPMSIDGVVTGAGGVSKVVSSPFQASDCSALPLNPKLALTLVGSNQLTDGKHPGLQAHLTQAPGETALREVSVTLPLSLALDTENARGLCKPEEATARKCPESSIIGQAKVKTPVLPNELTGPVYFVEGRRLSPSGRVIKTLPKLWIPLRGDVELDLWADSATPDNKHLVTTFTTIPDAPVSAFDLSIEGGEHGVIAANTSICNANQILGVATDGQNGKRTDYRTPVATPCPLKLIKQKVTSKSVSVTIGGLGAGGKVTIRGTGVKKTTRTVTSAVASIAVPLTTASRRAVARHRSPSIKLTASFTPKGAKKARKVSMTTATAKKAAKKAAKR